MGRTPVLPEMLCIGHPLGVMAVKVVAEPQASRSAEPRYAALGLTRTARRLMAGTLYVPAGQAEMPMIA